MKLRNGIAGADKEDFEVMPDLEMPQGGKDAGEGGREAEHGGGGAEALADLLSLIARLGTQVMYLYLCLDSLTYTNTNTQRCL